MRITNQMLQQSALRDLRANLDALARSQHRAASGQRISTMSDDPVDATRVMGMDAQLRDLEQFRRNATSANTRLSTEDVVLGSVRDLISRAKELAISARTLAPGDPERASALSEVQLIRQQLIALGNTQVGNDYIFGGAQTTAPPFQPDGTYVGDLTVRRAAIDNGVFVDVNHAGQPLFTDALQAVSDLETALQSGSANAIGATLTGLSAAGDQALTRPLAGGLILEAHACHGERLYGPEPQKHAKSARPDESNESQLDQSEFQSPAGAGAWVLEAYGSPSFLDPIAAREHLAVANSYVTRPEHHRRTAAPRGRGERPNRAGRPDPLRL
jgi:flagellar hook-associated protein 3 FlgL